MKRIVRHAASALLTAWLACLSETTLAGDLEQGFQVPPDEARPWVYWIWNNGNVTRDGITADLEAMQRVGIGGVILMDVVERFAPPRGSAEFMNAEWRELFQHSVREAGRLGLEVNMNNGPGWCGSSGAWITPDLSMQKLVWSNLNVSGPLHLKQPLQKPDTSQKQKPGTDVHQEGGVEFVDNYHDIAVVAFPVPSDGKVPRESVLDLTSKLDDDGKLDWMVPAGNWLIQRIGHTTTGSSTRPPVAGGSGLECDKMSRTAVEAQFAGMMAGLVKDAGPMAGKALTATHIDSWEVGGQNWTPPFRDEFVKRRGYDPIPFLPSILDGVRNKTAIRYTYQVGGGGIANRFRWDFQQTQSELLADNYAGRLAELAREHGLRLTIEGYNLRAFGDEGTYAARADEPMTEFWTPSEYGIQSTKLKGRQVASLAHTTGKRIVGAEAFTSGVAEMWKQHPATIKALGDEQFCHGINRFVIHRYAHQPYADRAPGVTMGPWGLHYERTQTWWEMSGAWHQYLTRCQHLLRQGLFVADLCYLRPEVPSQTYFKPNPEPPAGYRHDEISAEALLARMSVKEGRLMLPDGMNYRMLVIPPVKTMTPALATKLRDLVKAGATVVAMGPRPNGSPSLQNFPDCDAEVLKATAELWGNCDGRKVMEHRLGKGRLTRGLPAARLLADAGISPDFQSDMPLNWIHRQAVDMDMYFVANPADSALDAECTFRVNGRQPELWDPLNGGLRALPQFDSANSSTLIRIRFGPAQSFFIVFRKPATTSGTGASNFPQPVNVATLNEPWQVTFDPKWGGPGTVDFPALVDWTRRPEQGIKHYSGTATYNTRFDLSFAVPATPPKRFLLDLGTVHVMARVKLNGRDCGIAWHPPFRVDVTGALKTLDNTLEIQVANLWPNRLIGDQSQPENRRLTWTTWNPFEAESPLLSSGLLGPLTLWSE